MSNVFDKESRRAERLAGQLDRLEPTQPTDAKTGESNDARAPDHSPTSSTRSRATKSTIWLIAAVIAVTGVIQLIQPTPPQETPAPAPAVVQVENKINIHRIWFESTNRSGKMFLKLSSDAAKTPSGKTLSLELVNLQTGEASVLGKPTCKSYNDSTTVITECAVDYAHTESGDLQKVILNLKADDGSTITGESHPVVVPKTHGAAVTVSTSPEPATAPSSTTTAQSPATSGQSMDVTVDAVTRFGVHYTVTSSLDTQSLKNEELTHTTYITNLQTRVRHLVESDPCIPKISDTQRVDQCSITLSKRLPDAPHQLVVEVNLSGKGVVSARSIQFQTR